MNALKLAIELAAEPSKPYPTDSTGYRKARTGLLVREIELRRDIERVAAERHTLPPGGEARGCGSKDENGISFLMADRFGERDTLVTYF